MNLLPFIDVKLLKETIETHCPASKLSPQEKKRNSFGSSFGYRHDLTCSERVEAPSKSIGVPDITACHSAVFPIQNVECSHPFQPVLVPGTQIPYPAFPSLHVIPIAKHELLAIGLNCFGSPSKYQTRLLSLHAMPELPPIETLAQSILGRSLYVNWPSMHEGKAVAVCDGDKEVRLVQNKQITTELAKQEKERWASETTEMTQLYFAGNGTPGSGGLNIGDITIRLKLLPLQGMRTVASSGATKKVYGKREADVPLQLALWQSPAPDPRFKERGPMTLADRFPESCRVILTKGKYRGCTGSVVGVVDSKNVGVMVDIVPTEVPFGISIARSVQESYLSSYDAAKTLKMNPGVFGKIMGRLQFSQGKYDLGLNLKSSDGKCVVGYTRKKVETTKGRPLPQDSNAWAAGDSVTVVGSSKAKEEDVDDRIQWEYTPNAIRLVVEYKKKFPQLFSALSKNPNEKKYDAIQVFGPNGEAWLPVVREWLDKHETASLPRSPVTTESMSYEAIAAVQKAADVRKLALRKKGYPKTTSIKVPGSALYREGSTGAADILTANDLNEGSAPILGDRIVNICAEGVPFGARGTVVGIHEAETTGSVEVVMDDEFIGGTSLQGACSNYRGKLCLWAHLLRIAPSGNVAASKDVNKIMASLKAEIAEAQPEIEAKESEVELKQLLRVDTINSKEIATPARSGSRSESAGRSKVAYKESKGPAKKGSGFTDRTGNRSGLKKWKQHIKSGPKAASGPTDQLKSLLGVSPPAGVRGEGPGGSATQVVAANELKAVLGVVPSTHPILPQAVSMSAADQLMNLMSQKSRTEERTPIAPVRSGFNFTYVEAGKEPPEPGPIPPAAAASYSMAYSGFPVHTQHSQINQLANSEFPPLGENQDFPPLGGEPAPAKVSVPVSPSTMMVPSVVATKGKRK